LKKYPQKSQKGSGLPIYEIKLSFFLSFFLVTSLSLILSWVANTQRNHWTNLKSVRPTNVLWAGLRRLPSGNPLRLPNVWRLEMSGWRTWSEILSNLALRCCYMLPHMSFLSTGPARGRDYSSGRQNWRIDKIGDSGVKQVILKYCWCTTYCSTSHQRERQRSRDNGHMRTQPSSRSTDLLTAPSCHRHSFPCSSSAP